MHFTMRPTRKITLIQRKQLKTNIYVVKHLQTLLNKKFALVDFPWCLLRGRGTPMWRENGLDPGDGGVELNGSSREFKTFVAVFSNLFEGLVPLYLTVS